MMVAIIYCEGDKRLYSSDYGPSLMFHIMSRCKWRKIELVEMTLEEYQAIPATNEAAHLFIPGGE